MEFRQTLRLRVISWLRRLSFCALLAMLLPAFATAQSVISPPIAQVFDGGKVYAIARQIDGKVIIGGAFAYVNGTARSNIARLNSNGSLDATWNPDADNAVYELALDGAGNVLVGGVFRNIAGLGRVGLAKIPLAGTGAADATWNPNSDGGIYALALDPGGANVYVGGSFSTVGGQARVDIAKVSIGGTGVADATWDPNPDSGRFGITGIVVDAGGSVFVSGGFYNHIGGLTRVGLAKLSGSGTGAADPAWDPHPSFNGGNPPVYVGPIALDTVSSALYVGGYFDHAGGQIRANLAKVAATGSGAADPTWNPNPGGQITALAVDPTGNVYVSGLFGLIGGLPHAWMARLSGAGSGAADAAWNPLQHWTGHLLIPGFFTSVPGTAFAFDASGNVFAGGSFTSIGGQTKTGFAYLSASGVGAADPAWASAMIAGTVGAIARDGSGRTVIAGSFEFMGDGFTVRNNLARFDAAGNLDAVWAPEANDPVAAIALDGSGNVFAGGQFTVAGGQPRQFIAKLTAAGAGAADAAWNPNADAGVTALAFDQASGSVFAGGAFANIGGQSRASLAKLSAAGTGAADPTWNPSPTVGIVVAPISALALDGAGKLYVGGTFSNVGGQPRNNLARLSTSGTGAADAGWNPNADAAVVAFALDTSGSVYVGGGFSNIGGLARTGIARLSVATGTADPVWRPDGFGVDAIALDGNGHVYAGGNFLGSNFPFSGTFFSIGGSLRAHVARLSTSGIGAADCTWIADADSVVLALALDAGGDVYLGGTFGRINGLAQLGYAVIGPGSSPGCRVAITSVNGGIDPSVNAPFPVVVQSQDFSGLPQSVATDTVVTLSLHTGAGVLGGTLSCQINAGTDSCTASGVTYSQVESGVILTITRTSGDTLAPGNSAPLTIVATQPPTKLAFTDINGGPDPVAGVAFSVTVQAQEANGNAVNVLADTAVSIALNTGTGVLTLTGPIVAQGCTIANGTNSCSVTGVFYSRGESGVVLTAFAPYAAGVIAGNSAPFTVDDLPNSRELTVLAAGGGGTSVTSTPPGIDCAISGAANLASSATCSAAFPIGTSVTLTYSGTAGSFISWGGDCSGTTPSCSVTLNSAKTVSTNVVQPSFNSATVAFATQATTTVVGNQTLRVDQTRTRIVGRYLGTAVYDQTFNGPLADPAVQAAIVAAANAVRAAAGNPSLKTTVPAFTGTIDTVLSTSIAFSDIVTALPVAVTATANVGPQTLPIGVMGNCVLAPTNCAGPYSTLAVPAGEIDILVLYVETTHTDRTVITTDKHAITSTYELDDDPFAATITTTALISSQNPSTVGQPVTFTATVSNGASATGSVQFKDGASDLGPPIPLSGTTAALTTSALPAGTRAITATYSGDATNGSSTSPAVNQVVSGGLGTDANLSALTISSGSLVPAFAPGTFAYTDSVLNCVAAMTVTPTLEDPTASVKVNGATVASGTHSASISLAVGANPIDAVVTAQNGVTTQTYALAVTRAAPPPLVPTLQSAVSRRVHGAAGTFDLPLSLTATNPTTEPRTGPNQTIVFTFDKAINGAVASISEGTATAATPTFSGNDVVVALTGVSNQQYVTIALANVASTDGGTGGCASARLGFLAGDVNQNRVVTLADLGLVNAQLAQFVTVANFLKDVNASGTLTLTDKGITNANLTRALPPP